MEGGLGPVVACACFHSVMLFPTTSSVRLVVHLAAGFAPQSHRGRQFTRRQLSDSLELGNLRTKGPQWSQGVRGMCMVVCYTHGASQDAT